MVLFCVHSLFAGVDYNTNVIDVNIIYLEDPKLPSIQARDIDQIIYEAQQELFTKFGVNNLYFNNLGKKDITEFFNQYLKTDSLYYKELSKKKVKLYSDKIDYLPYKVEILKFIKQWKLWDLKSFFSKEIQKKIRSYSDVLPFLYDEYHKKLKKLESLKLSDGQNLIDKESNLYNSYLNWLVVMHFQKEYDIIISNTIIVYDDISMPYPHAVLRFAKVGGSSFDSPNRKTLDGRSAMVNLFEMLTTIDYFKEGEKEKKYSKSTWNGIIGRYIMAHEMGHMIYLIPDVYDHPKGCLMDSSNENLDYYQGYQILKKYPNRCPKCEPYIEVRNKHFEANQLVLEGKYDEAIYAYKRVIKMTPKKLDTNYNSYKSLIYFKMAKVYIKMDDKRMAKYYLNKALKLDKNNLKAKNLLDIIQ